MKAIFYLLIFVSGLLLTVGIAWAEIFPQAFTTPAAININGCVVSFDSEDNSADFSTNISPAICNTFNNITNITTSFTFSKSVSLLFVRNVTCGESDIENLTKRCINLFEEADYIANYTYCREAKIRLEENYDSLHDDWESSSSTAQNKTTELTQCSTQLVGSQQALTSKNSELDLAYQEKSKVEIEMNKYKSERWTYALVAFGLGILGYYGWQRKGVLRNPKENFPRQERIMEYDPEFEKRLKEEK